MNLSLLPIIALCERPGEIVYGLKAFMKAVGAIKGVIAIEDNKLDAVASMKEAVTENSGEEDLEVHVLHTKSPGAETLILATTGRKSTGALPWLLVLSYKM